MSESPDAAPLHLDLASDADQRRAALAYLGEAWDEATLDGVDPDCLAQAAIFLAFQEFVDVYGEAPAAKFAESIADRVRAGEYTVRRVTQ